MSYRIRVLHVLSAMACLWYTLAGTAATPAGQTRRLFRMADATNEARGLLSRIRGQAKAGKGPDVNMVSLEVSALRDLRTLRATPAQMKALLALHKKEFIKQIKREPAKTTAKYRKTLELLRTALIQDDDDDIKAYSDKLEILDDEDEEVFDGVETTPASYEPAREAMRLFTLKQILAFMKSKEDYLSDPADILIDALDTGLTAASEEAWNETRDEAVKQVTWMISGLAPKTPGKVRAEVLKWINAKHALKAEDFNAQKSALQAEASKLFTSRVPPTTLLTNFTWYSMAELLCNPRLPAALRARLKATEAAAK